MSELFKAASFSIVKREGSSDFSPDWDSTHLEILCKSLLNSPTARGLFLTSYLVNHPPLLISDPDKPFGNGILFGPSAFFNPETILIFRDNETRERQALQKLMVGLVEAGCLVADHLSIIKCSCGHFSIGTGDTSKVRSFHCTYCNMPARDRKTRGRITTVYSFPPLIRDVLINKGKILEGLIYHRLKQEKAITERYNLVASAYLSGDPATRPDLQHELDLLLMEKAKPTNQPLVLLASISINQGEKDQVQDCAELGLETIFVCGRGINAQASIHRSGARLFTRVIEEPDFLDPLAAYVLAKCGNTEAPELCRVELGNPALATPPEYPSSTFG